MINLNCSVGSVLEHHLELVHGISKLQDKEDYGDLITLTRYHQCFICLKIVKHEYKGIYQHLALHNTDVLSYTKKFITNIYKELRDKGREI